MQIKILTLEKKEINAMEEKETCTNCLFGDRGLEELPCNICEGASHWTSERTCSTCRWEDKEGSEEPCKSCNAFTQWERDVIKPYRQQAEREYTNLVENFSESVVSYGITKFNEGYYKGYTDCKEEYQKSNLNSYDRGYHQGFERAKQIIIELLKRKEK